MEPVELPGVMDSLKTIRDYVSGAANAAGLDKQTTYKLVLAVDEIATNSIVHGYQESNMEGVLRLRVDSDDEQFRVTLEDHSPPYDPRQTPPPVNLNAPPEERKIGGLGVFLVLQGVDKLEYERDGEWNRHIFIINREA